MREKEILLAIKEENIESLKEILSHEPRLILIKDESGIWAPFLAAATGNLPIVQYIVEYSFASMNERDPQNQNMLHYAARSGNVELLRYLVEKVGLSPVEGDQRGVTPYDIVRDRGHQEAYCYFEEVVGAPLEDLYRNPIRTGMHPDPSIVRVGEDYYMVNSSFIFFPCIPISHSKDLIHWKVIGHAITDPNHAHLDELEGGRGYWAPDISYYEGRFYITATYRLNDHGTVYRKQMVTSSENPEGPYCEPVFIDEDGIDPSIFTDEDGRRYMLLNRGARIFEISPDATKKCSEAELLWYGDNKRAPEGPHLLKKDGYYYLFMAEGGTGMGHRITVARSKTLKGNYEPCPYNPIMRQEDEGAAIQRAGHGKPVMTQNGEWYMVYLCGRQIEERTILGRETALDPITWTADGWPIVNGLKGPSVLQKKPNLENHPWEEAEDKGFGERALGHHWVFPRSPLAKGHQVQSGSLQLVAGPADLKEVACRTVVLQSQTDFNFSAQVALAVDSLEVGQCAGLTGYYDENTYLKFGVEKQEDGTSHLVVKEWIMPEERLACKEVLGAVKTIWLRMETRGLSRSFHYSIDGVEWMEIGKLDRVDYLCDEGHQVGKRFTGAMVGVYTYHLTGEGVATFSEFKVNHS